MTTFVPRVPRASPVTPEALAPIIAAVTPVLQTHRHPGLAPGLVVTDGRGWVPATQLVNGARLAELFDSQRRRRAPVHVAAALAWKSYCYWLALPVVVGWASAGQVPLLRPADVLVRFADDAPMTLALRRSVRVAVLESSPLATAGLPHVCVVRDSAAMLASMRSSLLDGHLMPIIDAIQATVRVGTRTLLGSVSSGMAMGLLRAAGTLPGSVVDHIGTLLGALGIEDLVEVVTDPAGGPAIRRRTCCLAFTLPRTAACSTCCIDAGSAAARMVIHCDITHDQR